MEDYMILHVQHITAIRDALGLQPTHIYHPCCHIDESPSHAFPSSMVTYVDTDTSAIQQLQQRGFTAIVGNSNDYVPSPSPDLILMINPCSSPKEPAQHLAMGGYFLCNDAHHTASELFRLPEFQLVAVTTSDEPTEHPLVCTEHLTAFKDPVETDAEYAAADSYGTLRALIRKHDGATRDWIQAHLRLRAKALVATRQWEARMIALQPWMDQEPSATEESFSLMINPVSSSRRIGLIPRKRHGWLYAFQKVS